MKTDNHSILSDTRQLTFTRFIAALIIVIYHFGVNIFPFNWWMIEPIAKQGSLGVSYFFILSGFVLLINYFPKSQASIITYRTFYISRFARIYPVYFIALFLFVSFDIYNAAGSNIKELLLSLFLIQAWLPHYAICLNYPGWSLSVEFLFYLIFPVLLNKIYVRKFRFNFIVAGVLIIWAIGQIVLAVLLRSDFYKTNIPDSRNFAFFSPVMHVNEFLIGNVTGLLFLRLKALKIRYLDLICAVIIVAMGLVMHFKLAPGFHDGLEAIVFAPLVLFIALNNGYLSSLLRHRYLILLGEASYGLYILQVPVFRFCIFMCKEFGVISIAYQFYISLSLLILISIVSFLFFETPVRRMIKNQASARVRVQELYS